MTRLPVVNGDNNGWGTILNAFLAVGHNADGTLKAFYNIKDTVYGAVCDGVTDDTTAVRTAIASASSAGGGCVWHPGGVCITQKLTLPTGVWLDGPGYEAAVYKLKSGTNDNLIETTNFSTLTGTDTSSTPYNFGIRNLTLDGNKAGQSSGTSHGVAIYGYGYTLQNIRIRNARSYGLWTEWGTTSASPGNDSMEAFITDFKIHDCTTGGINHKGPHDAQFHDGIVYNNGNGTGTYAINIPTDQYGSGSVFSMVHVWGGNYDYAVRCLCTGITLDNVQLEGSLLAEVYLGANNCIITGKLFSLEPLAVSNVVKGVVFANSAVNAYIKCKMENMGGGVVDVTNSGGDNYIDIFAVYYTASINVPSPAIVGSVDAQSTVILHVLNRSGVTTSDSTLTWPGALSMPSLRAGQGYASGVGINTGISASNALAIETGADGNRGIVLFAHSGSQSASLFAVQNASFADQFTIDKAGNTVQQGSCKLGGAGTLFSGSGAPGTGLGSVGDYYFRIDTPSTANQRIYVKTGSSTWTGIV